MPPHCVGPPQVIGWQVCPQVWMPPHWVGPPQVKIPASVGGIVMIAPPPPPQPQVWTPPH
jgi:hypothetical protein